MPLMKPHKKKRMRSLNILSLILLPLASKGCPFLRSQGHTERMLQSDYITELLDNHQDVDRSVSKNADGSITTVTTSTRDEVGGWLQDHVATMKARLERGGTPRPWDPFFVALSDHHDEFDATISNVNNPRGVKVDMRASTMCGQDLIDGHTAVVSKFVSTGRVEAQKSHDAPASCGSSSSGR